MSLRRQFMRGLRVLANREAAHRETAGEIRHYLEEAEAAFMAKGFSPAEAKRLAQVEFGSATAVREQVLSYGWENRIEMMWADLRYAVRTLANNPGFVAISIVTLALGIGASTAIFSVANAILLRALPYPNPRQIVRFWEQAPDGHRMNLADFNFDDLQAQNNTFSSLAAYNYELSSVSGGSKPVRVNIAAVSKDFFDVLGANPFRGRAFDEMEQRLHGTPAAIVSYGYWKQYLGGGNDLSRCVLHLDGGVYPVVGIMPDGFDFPQGVAVWIPRGLEAEIPSRTAHNWRGIGRIREGVSLSQARANLSTIARRIKGQYGKEVDLNDAAVVPLAEAMVGDVKTAILTLLCAVGLLLLVACANVAALLLARTSARRKELAMRAALGAGRGRLMQQFLAEAFALSVAGGLLGTLLAACSVRVLPAILPANLPRQEGIAINAPVLLFALAVSVIVALALGLFGAWRASTGDLQDALADGSRSYTGTGASRQFRGFLVIGEIAITLVILMGAGLLGRSFLQLISTNAGFDQRNLLTLEFSLPASQWKIATEQTGTARQVSLLDGLVTRLRGIPGVEAAGLAGALPVAGGDNLADGDFLILAGRKAPANFDQWDRVAQDRSQVGHALYAVASQEYFRTLGIRVISGRMFGEQDDLNSQHVAIISQSLARQRWPNQNPIGQLIEFGNMDGNLKPFTIIGIAGDVRAQGLDSPPSPIIYVNYRQRGMNANSSPAILLRTAAPAGEIFSAARAIFHELAPDAPVKLSTFAEEMGGWLADRRFLLLLVALFALAALVLAAVGIYGVVAFSVTRRTQEIGTRVALGARRSDILRLVLGEGSRLALLGVAIGVAVSFGITRLLSSLLFGVRATDPLTFIGVAALLALVALVASYLPARRAMRLDPNAALRHE